MMTRTAGVLRKDAPDAITKVEGWKLVGGSARASTVQGIHLTDTTHRNVWAWCRRNLGEPKLVC
jgi:hypothetical protein